MERDQSELHPASQKVKKATDELKRLNQEMTKFINKLPLDDFRDVLRLAKIAERQSQLIRFSPGPAPPGVLIFLENAKYSALHLNRRYSEALRKGLVRKSAD
jgi:hypothetical protein